MSTRPAQFDAETGRSVQPSATQARSRSEKRHEGSREGRGAHRARMGASEVEPTEVGISHKKAYGKTSEKAQLKISKARSHGSHVSSSAVSESSQPSLDYVSSHLSARNTQDYSPKSSSSLYASTTADSERTKFMDNIPGIPASEQLTQRGDRAGRTLFPPPSVSNYGQNVTYPTGLSSDVKSLPKDTNNTSDLVFCKAPTNRHSKSVRVKGQAETEMQWNATQENSYRPRDDQRNRPVTNEFHYSTRTRGRRNKDGGNIVYNDVKFSGSSRQNVARRSTSISYSESPTDSQGSSTESESDISSSPDTSLKRRRRIRRKPSNKSIGSSVYGDDNTSESENQSVSEPSDTSSAAYSQRKRRTQFPSEEPSIPAPLVSYKEFQSATNKIRSSSLTSVSSLEGAGLSGDPSRIQSPLLSPKGTSIAKVRKIQIRSFTSFADSHLNDKENQPQRRRSTEERESFKIRGRSLTESFARDLPRDRPPLTRQGSESPSLSKSPFSLKSKPFVRKSSKDSLFSDSECNNIAPDRGHASTVYDVPVSQEQEARCNSAPPAPTPIDTRESRLHSNLPDSGLASSRSAFVPVKPNKRTINDHEPSPPVAAPVTFADSRPEKGNSTLADVLLQPVPRHGNRPLSIVQETDEFVDVQEDDGYEVKKVEKMSKKSHVSRSSPIRASQDCRTSSPSAEGNSSTLRRLSYVRAQKNSADLPTHPPAVQPLNNNSNSDSSPTYSPAFSEVPSSRRYNPAENNDTKRVLKEFDPVDPHEITRTTAPPVVAEGDLISFDDENGEVKEPVKKRTKRISRPKIPTILSGEEEEYTNDVDHCETSRGMVEEGNVSYNKDISGLFDGSNRDTIIAHDSDEDSTPRAASDAEENEPADSLGYNGGSELDKGLADSYYHSKGDVFEDISQKYPSRRRLQKRASLPLIKTELYQDEAKKVEEVPKMEVVVPESPTLRKAETISDLSLDEVSRHLKVIPYNSGDLKQRTDLSFQDDKSLESCSPPPGSEPSPSPSQISFDALSLTTSGFSETHSEQVSTGDLNVVDDLLGMDAAANVKSLDAWRSQSDPSHGTQLEDTIAEAELQAHRNSNSEPNLSGEKLKEEAEQLAKRVNGGNQVEPKSHGITGHDDDDNDDDKDTSLADLSPDDGCYELDKPEHRTKPVQRAKSAPTPTTPTTPRSQRIANSFAVEKAQVKLNKLAAMETIIEMPHAEPSITIEKPKVEKKRSTSLEGSCASPAAVPKEDKRKLSVSKEPGKAQKSKHDLRAHVLKNLLDTEMSYVQNLQFLVSSYYKALKKQENAGIVEAAQVDEMFYQIPEILLCHEFFLQQLQARVNEWHDKQKIGDIFVSSFTKCFLVDAYSAFINHFLQARAAVRVATVTRPAFVRYMEQCSRDHKEKLTLQDLMIMPVQRIPRYELILKDMIKHTPHDHPDHGSLQLALGEIKTLADRMNRGEKEVDQAEREAERLRDLEATIEGMTNLVTSTRRLIRQDLVAEVKGTITKKDRCLFLFNDMLVCATVKRKANALRRGSLSIFSGSGTEFNKYKLLWRLHLDSVEVYKSSPEAQRRNSLEKQLERLDNDMSLLSKISILADTLAISHMTLDGAIRELMNEVNRQISEKQIPLQPPTSTKLELHVTQAEEDGPEEKDFQFLFLETEIKNSWEAYFEDAKQKLAYAKDIFPPEFQYCIPINKTRSGMQFTCASPCQVPHMLDRGNHCGSGDVWVCNSDGYVGQVCILRMGAQIQPFGSITVCMSRILCISPVPGTKFSGLEALQSESETKSDTQSISLGSEKSSKANTTPKISRSGYASDEDVTGPQNIMAFDSSSEDEEGLGQESFLGGKFTDGSSPFDVDGRLSPEGSSLGTTGSADGLDSSQDENVFEFEENDSSCDEMKAKGSRKHSKRRMGSSRASEDLKDSLSDIVNFDTDEACTVWLGTEDGCIFVYPAKEAQNKKSKLKLQHSGSIQCILYVDNQVFISLSTGHLYIYRRQPGCAWEVGNPVMLHIGESAAVSCMTAIHGRLWCGLGCNAVIVNTTTLAVETSFSCSLDKDHAVYRMASSGMGVWVTLQNSSAVRLFHATRYECLADVDVAPPVHKMLQGSDAIIRQHKAACLRVTALLACKDLLWIGTSAGVVLTLPLPTITASTASLRNCPSATASFHGHTGHVRFLTAVEVPREGTQDNTNDKGSTTTISTTLSTSPSTPTAPHASGSSAGRDVLIISGGDGYEDFRTSSASESAGRDDSTNHLLIWRV